MNGYKVVVTKSTVPIGTGEHLRVIDTQEPKIRPGFWYRFESGIPSRGSRDQRFHATRSRRHREQLMKRRLRSCETSIARST